ncbi:MULTISPECIES: TetR/AcrR family transcriptional regulator [unclassified Levilactobacillus]|uniref:TetR/AcrR family transcriptional regulator n=1 Tax=unclassified Levilactobacillus TaxID=2767918 RepID=UPI002FF23EA9
MAEEMNIQEAFKAVMAANGDIPPKQQQVLAASLDLFAQQGFANTTTKQIAEKAGVAEGTVYRRYKTKDELLAAVLAPFVTQVLPRLITEFAEGVVGKPYLTRHEMIQSIAEDRLAFIQKNGPILRILIREVSVRKDLRSQFIQHAGPLLEDNLFPVLDRLKARGELVDWPNSRIAQFMIGTMLTELVRSLLVPEEIATAIPTIIKFLEKGLAPD